MELIEVVAVTSVEPVVADVMVANCWGIANTVVVIKVQETMLNFILVVLVVPYTEWKRVEK